MAFNEITEGFRDDNEARTEKLESFLIEEAIKAGVVKVQRWKL
jgi:hypothetical protein